MNNPRRLLAVTLAGIGAFIADAWPDLVVWHAASQGAVGDIDEVDLVGQGMMFSALLGLLVGWLMWRAFDLTARSPQIAPLDPWGSYALGLGIHSILLVTLLPALTFALILTDEDRSLADRQWLIHLVWLVAHALAAAAGIAAGRALLRRPPPVTRERAKLDSASDEASTGPLPAQAEPGS